MRRRLGEDHDIGTVTPVNSEIALAVLVHYAIGVTLALAYLLLSSSALGVNARHPFAALGFGLTVNALPWLIMFPAMGYGWFGADGHQERDCSSVAC